MKALIIDDEERAIINLKYLLDEFCPEIEVVDQCKNLPEGVKSIRKNTPELVFLDIEMPGHSGLELLDFFDENEINFSIIFTTAYNNYAIQAFKLSAVDYLLKPINPKELMDAVSSYQKKKNQIERLIALKSNLENEENQVIAVPVSGKIIFLKTEEILYLKGEGAYTKIVKTDKTNFLVSRNLKSFEDLIGNNRSLKRVQKSYIVNLNFITAIHKTDGSTIELNNGEEIPISTEKMNEILNSVKFLKR